MDLVRGDRLGKYEIVDRLAAGGMAEVYLARILGHGGFAKPVALKRMLPELAVEPGFRKMFMREAALAARLSHPHVVQIIDFAEEKGELYLAMEFVHGESLRTLHGDAIKKGATNPALCLPPMLAAHVARCVALALAYAWDVEDEEGKPLRLIHRDVSPHNVLLSWQGDVKLADFGIAKPAGIFTSVGQLRGKVLYMSPEQTLGGDLDARSDLFALGIVLYETALGHPPIFRAGDQDGITRAVRERAITPPVRVDPGFPPGLSAVIMKALERDPAKRFQSGAEMAEALGDCLHREAKGPQDYDVAGFMRRMYGEPRLAKGLFSPPAPPPAAEPVVEDPTEENTVPGRLRAMGLAPEAPAQAAPPAKPTVRERRSAATDAEWARLHARGLQVEAGQAAAAPFAASGETPAVPQARERPSSAEPEPTLQVPPPGGATDPVSAGQPTDVREPPRRSSRLWYASAAAFAVAGAAGWGVVSSRSAQVRAPETSAAGRVEVPAPQPAPAAQNPPPPVAEPAKPAPDAGSRTGAPSTPTPKPPEPAVAAAPPPVVSKPAPKRPERRAQGTLVIHVRPWVHAWLDEEPFTGSLEQEAAPRLTRTVAAGRHVVHLRDGEGRERSLEVTVPGDRELRVEGVFDKVDVR